MGYDGNNSIQVAVVDTPFSRVHRSNSNNREIRKDGTKWISTN